MVQYLRHYYVSAKDSSIVLNATNEISGGKMHPNVIGLDVQLQLQDSYGVDYCLSTAPDNSDISLAGVQSLTETQWKEEWETAFILLKSSAIQAIYLQYKDMFAQLPDDYYHPYEMLYSNYIKRVEASAVTENMTEEQAASVAPVLTKEAASRGVSTYGLAAKVLAHAEMFDTAQANLLAERGRKVDRITAVVLDTTSVDSIKESIAGLTVTQEVPPT